jgi:predicted MFS family arabinose efflux permease
MSQETTLLPPTKGGFGPVLANRSFLVLWLGQVFSQTADKLVFILLVSIVGNLSTSSIVMSIALSLQASPSVLLGASAGVLVDRLDKRQVMISTNAARALCVALLGFWGHHSLVVAVALAFLISCCSQPFIPAEAATIPLIVKKEHLLQANSLFATTMIGSVIIAFTLGEPLIQLTGQRLAALIIGLGFLISVICLFFVRYHVPDKLPEKNTSFMSQLKEGFQYIKETRAVYQTLWQQVALFGMFASMSLSAIIFAKQELHTNFSWFLAMAGAGMGLGSWVLGHFGHNWNKNRIVVGGFFGSGIVLATLAFLGAQQLILAFVAAALLGVSSSLVAVPLQTRLQELVPEHLRGKVFGAQNMVLNIATTVPMAAIGFVVALLGLRPVLGLTGATMLVAGAWSWWIFRSRSLSPTPND